MLATIPKLRSYFPCSVCDSRFLTRRERLRHVKREHPPEVCVVCERPATTYYPDAAHPDRAASCGSFACEMRIQEAFDCYEDHR